jgi:hypothetical protein
MGHSNDIYNPIQKDSKLYLSIDHLRKGRYILNITLKDKIVKTVKITK